MPEPLRNAEPGEGPLAEAASRLERALDRLEQAISRAPPVAPGDAPPAAAGPAAPELQAANDALAAELAVTRRRGRRLKAAATEASEAIGRAVEEVRQVLDQDAAAQGQLEFPLESEGGSGDEPSADDPAPSEKAPTA